MDLRKYAQDTKVRSLAGFILILLFVGDGLIYLIYGPAGAISGLLCIGGGLVPLLMIWGLMSLVEWAAKKANE